MEKRPSSRLLVTFLPDKQRPSPAKKYPLKLPSIYDKKKKHLHDGQPSGPRLQWTLPRRQPPSVLIDRGDTGNPLENRHMSSSWRILSRLFRSRSAGFLCELSSGSSLQRCFALCERTTAENWWTTAAVLLTAHRADLDWKLCRDSAFSQRETGSWIWVSRFQLRYV